jgi:energy-coupling factor transport system permease protein
MAAPAVIRHPVAWCAWAAAALAAAFIDRNPFLQALLLLIVINVYIAYRAGGRVRVWKIGLALAVVPILFSVTLSRFGTHVLFTLPAIPIVGGRWTLDAALFGASTGAALLLTVAIFAVLQMTVRSADLVAILPRPFYRAGTTLALAIAFAPKTAASLQSIREARQLRGQRAGWRSAPQLLLPLLLTILERALQYGESLDARGFGSRRRSRYRPVPWTIPDLVAAGASLLAVAAIMLMPAQAYNPYLGLLPTAPAVDSLLAVLLLAIPAVTASLVRMDHAAHHA